MTHHKVAVELEKRLKHIKKLCFDGGITNFEMASAAAEDLAREFATFSESLKQEAALGKRIIAQLEGQVVREGKLAHQGVEQSE